MYSRQPWKVAMFPENANFSFLKVRIELEIVLLLRATIRVMFDTVFFTI